MGRLTGERRALAAAVLAFYGLIFLVVSMTPLPGWRACFLSLAGVYGLGFFALVAGYFWARWFAIGLGISGLVSGAISMWQVGLEPTLLFYGGTHAGLSLLLWGTGMASTFDGKKEWRDRFHLDENATHRLGKAIIRLGISLPYVVMYALAPREGAAHIALAVAGGTLAVVGLGALARLRTIGIAALAGAAALLGLSLAGAPGYASLGHGWALEVSAIGAVAVVGLIAAVLPFAGPIVRYLDRNA